MMKAKLLFAEDDALLLKTLGFYFSKKGYDVTLVHEGRDAMEKIRGNEYDLVVTDLNMPFASGLEIVSLIRNELGKQTPVILLTSVGIENTELEAFHIGANEFIAKPFSPQVLEVRIGKLLAQTKK